MEGRGDIVLSTERILCIMDKINREGIVHVDELANLFHTSETTIRRDLMELSQAGKLDRIHGGATKKDLSNVLTELDETVMVERLQINFDVKSRICKKASESVKPGECIFLDGGTSVVPMIDFLAQMPIKIVTHNHLIIQKIKDPVAEIIVIGGEYNAKYSMSCGPVAQNTLALYNFDRAFIGCVGADLVNKEVYTAEMETREIKKIAMHHAFHSYLMLDDSKLSVKGFCKICDTDAFERIYCNSGHIKGTLPKNIQLVD